MTPKGYLKQIEAYFQYEMEMYKKAKADRLDRENLELIVQRMETVKKEINEMK